MNFIWNMNKKNWQNLKKRPCQQACNEYEQRF